MSLKDILNAVTGRNKALKPTESAPPPPCPATVFPILRASEVDLNQYEKLPALRPCRVGRRFRHIAGSSAYHRSDGDHGRGHRRNALYRHQSQGRNGLSAHGRVRGRRGNIVDSQNVITGRMYFKPVENMPLTQTTTTIMPFNPATMAVAVAIMRIEEKLDALQKTAEETLLFLKLDKQSNSAAISTPSRTFSRNAAAMAATANSGALRNVEVQAIRREAQQNMLFYQEQVSRRLQEQSALHDSQAVRGMLNRRHGRVPRIPAFLLSLRLFDLSGRGAAGALRRCNAQSRV